MRSGAATKVATRNGQGLGPHGASGHFQVTRMASTNLAPVVWAVALVLACLLGLSAGDDCPAQVMAFLEAQDAALPPPREPAAWYFMHVPRTAGKTLHQCLLKTAVPPSARCAKGYDEPRLRLNNPSCRLFSSHDDYSLLRDLACMQPLTVIRDPVERVLSAYEFSVTQAAMGLGAAGDEQLPQDHHLQVETTKVWPWSQLIPWLQADMRRRLVALEAAAAATGETSAWVRFKPKRGAAYWWNRETNATTVAVGLGVILGGWIHWGRSEWFNWLS